MVFYDVLGLFMITYTEVTGTILNVFIATCLVITIVLSLNSIANDEGNYLKLLSVIINIDPKILIFFCFYYYHRYHYLI